MAICGRTFGVLQQAADEIRAAAGSPSGDNPASSKGTKGSVLAVVSDVTKPEDCKRFIAETVQRFGRLDILVNNAGGSNANHFETVDNEVWQADLDLKLFGAIRCSRAAILHMKQQGGRRIINITMVAGKQLVAKSMPTTISRAADHAFTKVKRTT